MSPLLQNALCVQWSPPAIEKANLRVADGTIQEKGPNLSPEPEEQVVDLQGALVLPGLVNGHTHLYSALAVGMPPPASAPQSFLDILKRVWWQLDQALDLDLIEISARAGTLEALRCGCTCLFDHHASPRALANALDRVQNGVDWVGLRAVLCYETTDRHGPSGREGGIAENRRYLEKSRLDEANFFAGLAGAHASFTCDDSALEGLARLTEEYGVGLHIHLDEGECDLAISRERYGTGPVERLRRFGLLTEEAHLVHGVHVEREGPEALEALQIAQPFWLHNPRSNLHNGVGHSPWLRLPGKKMLGTDGLGADMLEEARCAWQCQLSAAGDESVMPEGRAVLDALALNAERAGVCLGLPLLGKLVPGAPADLAVLDYAGATPFDAENLAGHLLYALGARHVRHVMIAGNWRLWEREPLLPDLSDFLVHCRQEAQRLWGRLQEIRAEG